ncbi:META domain-containing protein [Arsenicibacter rosenii]|uniref:DUF306 domain-containing protein n=1 Tax=Arsenicibacter rosenii TaxID=1750698 RepID=A0A1S2VJN1_9BACT|nr:META domain-containing protein [Arsenicibacter rosenii]OIN58971.1 hypothetical protein BLX24_12195 [Arsenicibacter rosenii]
MKNLFYCLFGLMMMSWTAGCKDEAASVTTRADDLKGTWVLKSVLMGDAMDAACGFMNEGKVQEMNVTFTQESVGDKGELKLYGQSSVNTFAGSYTIDSYDMAAKRGKLNIGALAVTKMNSPNAEFMNCETRYLTYLSKAVDFSINADGQLELSNTVKLNGSGSLIGESYKSALYFSKVVPSGK